MPRRFSLPYCLAFATFVFSAALFADEKTKSQVAPPETFTADQGDHWAYQPITRIDPPKVKNSSWTRNVIDRFILSDLETSELSPSPEADRLALIRRLTFDLLGLPPEPQDVERFVDDARPDAYERLVDRLLADPRHGERWAQHWLDLAHYADSNGFELDAERPDAWRYRDWVVSALNSDMPYKQFVELQIAGDELRPGDHSALIATGFGRCGPREVVGGNIDPEVNRQSELTEVTGTVGSVFLGLTMACARCHDHKFDALPTTDYYRLQSFFAGAKFVEVPIATKEQEAAFAKSEDAIKKELAPLLKEMAAIEGPYRKRLKEAKEAMHTPAEREILAVPAAKRSPSQKKLAEGLESSLRIIWEEVAEAVSKNPKDHARREEIRRQVDRIERKTPPPPAKAMALVDDSPNAPETFVLRRGDVKIKGPKVAPRPPGVLLVSKPPKPFPETIKPGPATPKRRAALAEWLTRADNPLPARVVVNRLWQHHFGKGIVGTPSDFGIRGESPTHPELLDHLAAELVDHGWSLKKLHRTMVTSSTYRQSSKNRPECMKLDPENHLLWRSARRRMDAESLRDALLLVSGELNPKQGGPGVRPPIEKEVEDLIFTEAEVVHLWPETADPLEHCRRSIYLFKKRNVRYPLFDAFDSPDTQTSCPERAVSTHALQALVLLNGDFAKDRAKTLAGRVVRESSTTNAESRVDRAYRIVLGRSPRSNESAQALAFLDAQTALIAKERTSTNPAESALADFCSAMLNRNEFLYVP